MRVAALILFGLALPAVAGDPVAGTQARWLFLTWLSCVAMFLTRLARRAKAKTIVLTVDGRGIFECPYLSLGRRSRPFAPPTPTAATWSI